MHSRSLPAAFPAVTRQRPSSPGLPVTTMLTTQLHRLWLRFSPLFIWPFAICHLPFPKPTVFRRTTQAALAASLCLLFTQSVFGANAQTTITPVQPPSIVFSLLRLTGAMALVFGCFLGGVWLYRNWQRFTFQNGKAPRLNVLESKSLGPRHGLFVVGYDRQRFLVASAPGGISMLTALPEASPAELCAEKPAPHPLFNAFLTTALKRGPAKAVPDCGQCSPEATVHTPRTVPA